MKSKMLKLLTKWFHAVKSGAGENHIKSFRERQQQEDAFGERVLGVLPVPLAQIVGSVGRYHDFDKRFRLRKDLSTRKLDQIKRAMKSGRVLPPVKLYQIRDEYYVLDGNHRVAAAKAFDFEYIDGHIVEFLPSRTSLENILYREQNEFKARTGLKEDILLTEVGKYAYLIKQIDEHRCHLDASGGPPRDFKAAAEDWYRTIYRPLVAIVAKSRLPEFFPKRTMADFFNYISYHQWEKGRKRQYGIGIDQLIPKSMEAFRKKMANLKEFELPEMKHWISAFILISVKAGREYRVMNRLFAMEDVVEVHNVHGEFDILTKIVMKRELLSSDAEIIGKMVHEKVRQIQGVVKTQTLIPISSRQKAFPASSPDND